MACLPMLNKSKAKIFKILRFDKDDGNRKFVGSSEANGVTVSKSRISSSKVFLTWKKFKCFKRVKKFKVKKIVYRFNFLQRYFSSTFNTVFARKFSHLVLVAKIPVAKMLNS